MIYTEKVPPRRTFCTEKALTNKKKSDINSPQFRKIMTDSRVRQVQISRLCSPLVPERLDCGGQDKVSGTLRRIRLQKHPECLGQVAQRYCKYCSASCRVTSLCVLVAMGQYLCRNMKSQKPSKDIGSLPAHPDEE